MTEVTKRSRSARQKPGAYVGCDWPGGERQDDEALLTEVEAARLRCQSPRTLQAERIHGGGCPYIKIGRNVRYCRRDVLRFIAERTLTPRPARQARIATATGTRQATCATTCAAGALPGNPREPRSRGRGAWRSCARPASPARAVGRGRGVGQLDFLAFPGIPAPSTEINLRQPRAEWRAFRAP
jgi:hypothetical protein